VINQENNGGKVERVIKVNHPLEKVLLKVLLMIPVNVMLFQICI